MGLRIAEVHKESIPQELGNMSIKALNNFGTHPLICTHHVTPVFRVELRGQLGRIDQVAEHDGELPSFSFGCMRGHDRRCWFDRWGGLGRRRWDRLGRWR